MSTLAIVTRPGGLDGCGRLVLGDAPPGAPPCDRCPEDANVELTRDSGRISAYCTSCLVELVDLANDRALYGR